MFSFTDILVRGDSDLGEPLYWDSYDRHCLGVGGSSPRPLRSRVARCSVPSEDCLHPIPPLSPYTTPPSTPPVNKGKCEYFSLLVFNVTYIAFDVLETIKSACKFDLST